MLTRPKYYQRLAYEQFTRLGEKGYPVIESSAKEAIADAEYLTILNKWFRFLKNVSE